MTARFPGFRRLASTCTSRICILTLARSENNPEPKPKASKRLSIGPRRVVPVRGSFDPRLQYVDPHPLYATASKSSRLSNIILPLHGCQCVQSSRGVARLALASTPPPLPPRRLVHPGWSMWRCTTLPVKGPAVKSPAVKGGPCGDAREAKRREASRPHVRRACTSLPLKSPAVKSYAVKNHAVKSPAPPARPRRRWWRLPRPFPSRGEPLVHASAAPHARRVACIRRSRLRDGRRAAGGLGRLHRRHSAEAGARAR